MDNLDEVLKKFCKLIKKEEFFRAHEVLEDVWRSMRKSNNPDSEIIRGFINGAVSLELKKRGKKSYWKVWKNYEKHKVDIVENNLYLKIVECLDNFKKDYK